MLNTIKRLILKAHARSGEEAFKLAQRAGLNITPNHFYVPLADVNHLRATRSVWAKPSMLTGIKTNLQDQLDFLRRTCLPFQSETAGNPHFKFATENSYGLGYGYIEAQALHGIIRSLKPRRVIEVGSGVSTYCMLRALEMNRAESGRDFELVCVEPYPTDRLLQMGARVEVCSVEALQPSFFEQLDDGDFLFIDSSHAVRIGGDVIYLYLEAIPRLKSGVYVHAHDIYLPYNYNMDTLHTYFQWCETALLQALLVNNEQLGIVASLSQLHYAAPNDLKNIFPEYDPRPQPDGLVDDSDTSETYGSKHFPASIYLRTGKAAN